jgi:hypothetical protein
MSLTLAVREYVMRQETIGRQLDALTDVMIEPIEHELYEYCKELYDLICNLEERRY